MTIIVYYHITILFKVIIDTIFNRIIINKKRKSNKFSYIYNY